jgi:hypothetical protein
MTVGPDTTGQGPDPALLWLLSDHAAEVARHLRAQLRVDRIPDEVMDRAVKVCAGPYAAGKRPKPSTVADSVVYAWRVVSKLREDLLRDRGRFGSDGV